MRKMKNEEREKRRKSSKTLRDLVIIFFVALLVFALAAAFDIHDILTKWLIRVKGWELDEVITVFVALAFAFGVFSLRR